PTAVTCGAGGTGGDGGALDDPQAVALDGTDLYVANAQNRRIDVFDASTGAFERAFGRGVGPGDVCAASCAGGEASGAAGALFRPTGIAVRGGEVYVGHGVHGRRHGLRGA